jgi:hypothetical protein
VTKPPSGCGCWDHARAVQFEPRPSVRPLCDLACGGGGQLVGSSGTENASYRGGPSGGSEVTMNRTQLACVACSLFACILGPLAAAPGDSDEPRFAWTVTQQAPPVRFEIIHSCDGLPGPQVSPDGRMTVAVEGNLQASIIEVQSGERVRGRYGTARGVWGCGFTSGPSAPMDGCL